MSSVQLFQIEMIGLTKLANYHFWFVFQDQFENLDKHTQWGIDFLERYAKFVRERLEIEQAYAKQLR